MPKRVYNIFSNGRLVRHQNTVYLHTYDGKREDGDGTALSDAAVQGGCVLEDLAAEFEEEGHTAAVDECLGPAALDNEDEPTVDETAVDENDTVSKLAVNLNGKHSDGNGIAAPVSTQRAILQRRPIPICDVEAFYLLAKPTSIPNCSTSSPATKCRCTSSTTSGFTVAAFIRDRRSTQDSCW